MAYRTSRFPLGLPFSYEGCRRKKPSFISKGPRAQRERRPEPVLCLSPLCCAPLCAAGCSSSSSRGWELAPPGFSKENRRQEAEEREEGPALSTWLQPWNGRWLLKESPGPRFVRTQNGEALPSITAPSDRCENKMESLAGKCFQHYHFSRKVE